MSCRSKIMTALVDSAMLSKHGHMKGKKNVTRDLYDEY